MTPEQQQAGIAGMIATITTEKDKSLGIISARLAEVAYQAGVAAARAEAAIATLTAEVRRLSDPPPTKGKGLERAARLRKPTSEPRAEANGEG